MAYTVPNPRGAVPRGTVPRGTVPRVRLYKREIGIYMDVTHLII